MADSKPPPIDIVDFRAEYYRASCAKGRAACGSHPRNGARFGQAARSARQTRDRH
jgi:hypothetical protein